MESQPVFQAETQANNILLKCLPELLNSVFDTCIVDDNRTGEIVLRHKASATLIMSDLLYKSNAEMVGPGGKGARYTGPEWFAEGQEELFYGYPDDNSGRQCNFEVALIE